MNKLDIFCLPFQSVRASMTHQQFLFKFFVIRTKRKFFRLSCFANRLRQQNC